MLIHFIQLDTKKKKSSLSANAYLASAPLFYFNIESLSISVDEAKTEKKNVKRIKKDF